MITITTQRPTVAQFRGLIEASGLHRPTTTAHLSGMLTGGDALFTAWEGAELVGMIRALTDHADVVYVADLAVAETYWHQGIGRQLMAALTNALGDELNYVLLASPQAKDYYQHLGFTAHPRGFFKPAH